jgi:molybdenum cofactor cytidylyltransferase
MRDHVAVVLAAGGSSRLGQPKQLLTRDGETLVHRAVRLAIDTLPRRVLVVLGAEFERIATAITDLDYDIVRNDAWQDGLASSLRAVGEHVTDEAWAILLLGCDQPALDAMHLERLLVEAEGSIAGSQAARAGDAGVVASRYAGVIGIPAVVPSSWFANPELTGDRGFGAKLRAIANVALIDAPELALDIDTPDDLREAQARGLIDQGMITTLPRARPVSR